jgi:hypothetical protein
MLVLVGGRDHAPAVPPVWDLEDARTPSQGIHGISEVLNGSSAGRGVIMNGCPKGTLGLGACLLEGKFLFVKDILVRYSCLFDSM